MISPCGPNTRLSLAEVRVVVPHREPHHAAAIIATWELEILLWDIFCFARAQGGRRAIGEALHVFFHGVPWDQAPLRRLFSGRAALLPEGPGLN